MNSFVVVGNVLGLGLAGLDSFGALMVVLALAVGVKRWPDSRRLR